MKKFTDLLYCLTFLLPVFPLAAQDAAPLKYEEFMEGGMEITEGLIPVYNDGEHIYIEIGSGLLGRSWLLTAQIDKGVDLRNRPLPASGVFYFELGPGHKLYVKREIQSQRTTGDNASQAEILANKGLVPVDKVYPVKALAKDKKGYIIDVTPFLRSGKEWFQVPHQILRNADHSTTEILAADCFDNGVQFRLRLQGEKRFTEGVSQVLYAVSTGNIPLEISCCLRLLPGQAMQVRPAGDKAGYESVVFTDYGNNPYGAVKDSVIHRWRIDILDKDAEAYRRGQLVKPSRPLVFYIDADCPQEYRSPIGEGILQWNKAFEQAGFSEAIEVRMLPEKAMAGTLPALVSFDLGTPGISSEKIIDPVTGEILYARINIGHGFAGEYLDRYLLQCGRTDRRITDNPESPEVVKNILRFLVCREIGKMLGLKPNYAASGAFTPAMLHDARQVARQGFTASVTDDVPFHYMACPGDGIAPDDLVVRVGEYDKRAIEWGYRLLPGCGGFREEREVLESLFRKKQNGHIAYCGTIRAGDVVTGANNLSADPLQGLEEAVDNLKAMYEKLETACYGNGGINDEGARLRAVQRKGLALYMEYMQQAANYIGGLQNGRPLPDREQRKAFAFLGKNLLETVPTWLSTGFLTVNRLEQPDAWIPEKIKPFFMRLFSPEVISRLAANGWEKEKGMYAGVAFWQDVRKYIFGDFDGQQALTAYQMAMQGQCASVLKEYAAQHNILQGDTDYAVELLAGMKRLASDAGRLAAEHPDQATAGFYGSLHHQLTIGADSGE